jgi:biopolymer transport protein ExbD
MKLNSDYLQEEGPRIELIPLIDVIFCILTFFLLAALQLTRQQAIKVDLPKASTGQTQPQEMLIVSIDPMGQTYIDKERVNTKQLEIFAKRYRQINPNGMILIYAPKESKYNDVVQVLDLLREIGGDRIALATLPGPPKTFSPSFPGVSPSPAPTNTASPGSNPDFNLLLPTAPPGRVPAPPGQMPLPPAPRVPTAPNQGGNDFPPLNPDGQSFSPNSNPTNLQPIAPGRVQRLTQPEGGELPPIPADQIDLTNPNTVNQPPIDRE